MTKVGLDHQKIFFDMYAFSNECSHFYPVGSFVIKDELKDIVPDSIYDYIIKHKQKFFKNADNRILKVIDGGVFETTAKAIMDKTKEKNCIYYIISNINVI